ncbi:MAG: hypothetical protein Kow006_26120 [Gammaproteobacteria bacterium]
MEDEATDFSRDDLLVKEGNQKRGASSGIVIGPMQWLLEDQRPDGYVQTTDLRLRAKSLGIRYGEVVPRYIRRPWRALLKKAKTKGLTEAEAKRVAEYSIIIAYKLRKAIEAAEKK